MRTDVAEVFEGEGLPGGRLAMPAGAVCHCGVIAVARMQGETDSWGHEELDLCGSHLAEMRAAEPEVGRCEWCGHEALREATRDPGEGMSGPVYEVCPGCLARLARQVEEDLADLDALEAERGGASAW